MFLRFFILLLFLSFLTSYGPESSSEEEVEETGQEEVTETGQEEVTETGQVIVECKCKIDEEWSTVTGRGRDLGEAKAVAQGKCPNKKLFDLIPILQLGECKQLN